MDAAKKAEGIGGEELSKRTICVCGFLSVAGAVRGLGVGEAVGEVIGDEGIEGSGGEAGGAGGAGEA